MEHKVILIIKKKNKNSIPDVAFSYNLNSFSVDFLITLQYLPKRKVKKKVKNSIAETNRETFAVFNFAIDFWDLDCLVPKGIHSHYIYQAPQPPCPSSIPLAKCTLYGYSHSVLIWKLV